MIKHKRRLSVLIAATTLALPVAASASLGGVSDSARIDAQRMAARSHSLIAASGSVSVHTMVLANGGTIRQYVNAVGAIYAITWQGPGKPDLARLLGPHFATFQADNASQRRRLFRAPPRVMRSDLVVQTGGHPGGFWGLAYLPQQAPAGFNPNAL